MVRDIWMADAIEEVEEGMRKSRRLDKTSVSGAEGRTRGRHVAGAGPCRRLAQETAGAPPA